MIVGVGIDVCDVERFGQALERRPGLVRRLFTPAEAERPVASLAARFAARWPEAAGPSQAFLPRLFDAFVQGRPLAGRQQAEERRRIQQHAAAESTRLAGAVRDRLHPVG